MSRDLVLTDPAGAKYSYDAIKGQGYLDGHRPGLLTGVGFLRAKAAALFEAGKHVDAVAMQKLAEEMKTEIMPKLEADAKKYTENYPEKVDDV